MFSNKIALVDLVYQLMDRLLDADTSEIADDAWATIPHPPPPLVRHHSTLRSHDRRQRQDVSDEEETSARITASLHWSTALLFGTRWCPSVGTGAGPHHAEEGLELVVGHAKHSRGGLAEKSCARCHDGELAILTSRKMPPPSST